MRSTKLNFLRWLSFILSGSFLLAFGASIDFINSMIIIWTLFSLWIICSIFLLIFFIYKNSTITTATKRFIIILQLVSILLYIVFAYFLKKSDINDYFIAGFEFIFLYSLILGFICFFEKAESILVWVIFVIPIGFILNRFGIPEGEFVVSLAFLLSSLGFIYLVFNIIPLYRVNKSTGRIFILFYIAIAVLNAIYFLKFNESRPAFNSVFDIVGVMVFLIACMSLFIILPFSNFIEWSKSQKQAFKRLIIFPLILFLLIFSLKFLLPGNVYRKIFFKEYSEAKRSYFDMKDYEIGFSKNY